MSDPSALQRLIAEMPPAHIVSRAIEVAEWSPCRSKRGVAVFKGGGVISLGYNYKPRGFECDGSIACKATCRYEAIHAEQQALLVAGKSADGSEMLHVKSVDGQLVPSGGPSCVQCSKLLLVAGVTAVWLYHAEGWQRYDAREFHRLSLLAQLDALLVRPAREDRAIREAFEEGFALSNFGGSISAAWERSEARQAAALSDPVVRPAREWHPIENAPKGHIVLVIVATLAPVPYIAYQTNQPPPMVNTWRHLNGEQLPVWPTHWMPLPQPPNVLPAPPGLAREAQTAHDTDQPV